MFLFNGVFLQVFIFYSEQSLWYGLNALFFWRPNQTGGHIDFFKYKFWGKKCKYWYNQNICYIIIKKLAWRICL